MSARRQIIPVFVPHLGCPNACVFCNQRHISGSVQPVTAGQVHQILEGAFAAQDQNRETELAFYGGSFTAIPSAEQEMLLGAALPFLRSGRLHSIRLSTRPDAIDDEVLDRLERFGVKTVELGAQSMVDTVLERSQRGHTAQAVREAAEKLRQRGFAVVLQMMTGLPGDDMAGAVYTAKELIRLKPDGVRIYPTVVIRDTQLYHMWKCGEYAEHTVEEAVTVCAELVPLFRQAKIPVIRLGLNPSEELSGGQAAAGAYHPALGELVYSRILRERLARVLEGVEPGSRVVLGVHKTKVSQALGQKRGNIAHLCSRFSLKSLTIREISCAEEEIVTVSIAK